MQGGKVDVYFSCTIRHFP